MRVWKQFTGLLRQLGARLKDDLEKQTLRHHVRASFSFFRQGSREGDSAAQFSESRIDSANAPVVRSEAGRGHRLLLPFATPNLIVRHLRAVADDEKTKDQSPDA